MANVELKQPIVDEISNLLKGAQSAVLVDYRGLTVAQDTELRRNLRNSGVVYKVYKNRLINRAIQGTEFEPMSAQLEGPTAIAVSKDEATTPARIFADFAKDVPALEMKGGVVEGMYYDADGMAEIAKIPGRDVLLGRLLGSMKSPIANFARVIQQIAEAGGAPAEAPAAEEEASAEAPAAEEEASAEAPAKEAEAPAKEAEDAAAEAAAPAAE